MKLEGLASSKKQNKQKLNWVRLAEYNRIPIDKDVKYINPHISFDGLHWFISVGVECVDNNNYSNIYNNEVIGIDLGIKDLAICSDNNTYKNINKTKKVKKLEKRKKKLQRQVSRKYDNLKENKVFIKDEKPKKTKNIIKIETKIKQVQHSLNGIRDNYTHQTTTEIIKRKPSCISIEDLNVSGIMKNKHLSKVIQQQNFYEFKRQLEYKTKWNNIQLRVIDKWYPSSKTCHECGYIKKDLTLSDREWMCPECGSIIDRDYNASLNIRDCQKYKIA